MLPMMKTPALSAALAMAVSLGAVAPAEAFGRNERNFLKGVAATLLLGAIVNEARARPVPAPAPAPMPAPRYEPSYQPHDTYGPNRGRIIGSSVSAGNGVSQAFNAYPRGERRAIQSRLRAYGYYSGAIDGVFGPATYRAAHAYARDSVGAQALNSKAGAFGVFDSLLY